MFKNNLAFCPILVLVFFFDCVSSTSSLLSSLRQTIFNDYDKLVKPDDQVGGLNLIDIEWTLNPPPLLVVCQEIFATQLFPFDFCNLMQLKFWHYIVVPQIRSLKLNCKNVAA